jgi:hypothetical protein
MWIWLAISAAHDGVVTVDIDAPIVTARSEKEQAMPYGRRHTAIAF